MKLVYKKAKKKNIKKPLRYLGLGLSLSGLVLGLYVLFPLLSWEIYLKPAFANQSFASPIPKTTIITKEYITSLLQNTKNTLSGVDTTNLRNWFPATYKEIQITTQLSSYTLSIPKLYIENAVVSTTDTDVGEHLVHFPGTALPPNKGTAAIFGHSTLPQLYNPKNYKTIFANLHTLKIGDSLVVRVDNTAYLYKIFNISIVDPEDTSYLTQDYSDSYITIITCTPPGTIWKRLILKTRLEKI